MLFDLSLLQILSYASLGFVANLVGGLLGIGGGVILVPMLLLLFTSLGFPHAHLMHVVIATSLSSTIFNLAISAWGHNRKGTIQWAKVKTMFFPLCLGSIAGALFVRAVSSDLLKWIFGLFIIFLGIYLLVSRKSHEQEEKPLKKPLLRAIAFFVATAGNILGISGGTFTVPLLYSHHVPMKNAIGIATVTGVIIASLGTLSFLFLGFETTTHYPNTLGYIYLPAFIIISLTSFLGSPYGVKLSHILPAERLRHIFGAILIPTGAIMFIA